MPLQLVPIDDLSADGHVLISGQLEGGWSEACADHYRGLRAGGLPSLEDLSTEGITVVDVTLVQRFLEEATIPDRGTGNFDVVRADFGENLAFMLAAERHSTAFGYISVRDRELIQRTGRGLDIVGVEDTIPPTLVLGEVKVSTQAATPPSVVDAAHDSLSRQHLKHLGDLQTTAAVVLDHARRATDPDVKVRLTEAAVTLQFDATQLRLVAYCVLIRPRSVYAVGDFGSFHSAPATYQPAAIRFYTVCVECDDLEATITSWHSQLTNAGPASGSEP